MNLINDFRYRTEVDGLRAIAVISVILFHAGFGCPGGYVGVDVFFVISGFLITSLIWKDLEGGKFTFANFWERRARRIVPALVVVTLVTLIAGWFLLLPSAYASLGKAAASQAVFAANIHYWLDSGYFSGAAEEKPLLHTWSLAVEEQFYLIVPFILWSGFHFRGWLRCRGAILSLLIVGCVLSLAMSIYGVMHRPSEAFYLLPTRAWELLLGSIVAFLPYSNRFHDRRSVCESVSLLGLALILAPVFLYTSETPFPGLAAAPPVLGACLIIWSNMRKDGETKTIVGRFLSFRPVVFIGLISYSLYLWHWPLIAFSKYWALEPLSLSYRGCMVALGAILAFFSWKFVEVPFRTRKLGASRKTVFIYSGVGLLLVLVFGSLNYLQRGFEERFSIELRNYAKASDRQTVIEVQVGQVLTGDLPRIGIANPQAAPSVLIWGDSHAMAIVPAIDLLLKEKGLVGVVATHSATAPVLNWYLYRHGLKSEAPAFNQAIYDYMQAHKIEHVILAGMWRMYCPLVVGGYNTEESADRFLPALQSTVSTLVQSGIQPWVILDVPNHTIDVPRALSRAVLFRDDISKYCSSTSTFGGFKELSPEILGTLEASGAQILNPKPLFLSENSQHYVIQRGGQALYSDRNHLSIEGARLMLLPFFRDYININ